MPQKLNLEGQQFGYLTVLGEAEKRGKASYWRCHCICGIVKSVATGKLRNGRTISCGMCSRKDRSRLDLTGEHFGRLTVLREAERRGQTRYWTCLCECGHEKVVGQTQLRNGSTASCGCLQTEARYSNRKTHGMAGTPEYRAWVHMIGRCTNPKDKAYQHYGGRGIQVCEAWRDFSHFYADMGLRPSPNHTLERLDVNGNYEPGNVVWAVWKVQQNNRRNNRRIECNGETLTAAQWEDRTGIKSGTIRRRLKMGIAVEQALAVTKSGK